MGRYVTCRPGIVHLQELDIVILRDEAPESALLVAFNDTKGSAKVLYVQGSPYKAEVRLRGCACVSLQHRIYAVRAMCMLDPQLAHA